jgi:hypothetical protein
MKNNKPLFGVLLAVVVAAVFLAIASPISTNTGMLKTANTHSYYQYY